MMGRMTHSKGMAMLSAGDPASAPFDQSGYGNHAEPEQLVEDFEQHNGQHL